MRTCVIAWMSSKFGQIRPLVSMATDSVIIWKMALFLMGSFSYLQVMMTYIRASMSLKFSQIQPDPTTDHRASCHLASEKIYVSIFLALYNGSQVSIVALLATCCICENKDADQLRRFHVAEQRLCFRYTDTTIPLLSKSEISSFQRSSVDAQPGLCRTWSETLRPVFSQRGSYVKNQNLLEPCLEKPLCLGTLPEVGLHRSCKNTYIQER